MTPTSSYGKTRLVFIFIATLTFLHTFFPLFSNFARLYLAFVMRVESGLSTSAVWAPADAGLLVAGYSRGVANAGCLMETRTVAPVRLSRSAAWKYRHILVWTGCMLIAILVDIWMINTKHNTSVSCICRSSKVHLNCILCAKRKGAPSPKIVLTKKLY